MGAWAGKTSEGAMATRWRRSAPCVLVVDGPEAASIRTLSAGGAVLGTSARPTIGRTIELRHPDAGTILGAVVAHHADGIALRFDAGEHSVAFALSAITADMSRPG